MAQISSDFGSLTAQESSNRTRIFVDGQYSKKCQGRSENRTLVLLGQKLGHGVTYWKMAESGVTHLLAHLIAQVKF
ncbi:hypothetical protein DPMN_105905 [Dreissena polymorpha]|uniref:Uncharacterized protein n=1 Tax=Dreissena polymorpha TaxID=45954 RepID=A0A9D4K412_DREPO|nr:hypothetical protein DPMN_105905 [Dreissena polymorpha]